MDFSSSASGILYNHGYLIYVEHGGHDWEATVLNKNVFDV